jgi:hypothetical protein
MYVIYICNTLGHSHGVEGFEAFQEQATVYSKLCHVTFLNLLFFREKQCQFYQGLVSGGKCYSLFTFNRMKFFGRDGEEE